MKTDQNTTKQIIRDVNRQLGDLLDEAEKISKKINEGRKETEEVMDEIDSKVNASITKIEQIFSDLDQIEREAEDGFDKFILQQAEDLANDE